MLEPGQSSDIEIEFTPREQKEYAFKLPFIVNGSSVVNVSVTGRGVPARLELANPSNVQVMRFTHPHHIVMDVVE